MLALSRLVDLTDTGFLHHGERVAIIAWLMAKECLPEKQAELFYAGLQHDVGSVPASSRVTNCTGLDLQTIDPAIGSHPATGSQLVRRVPGQQAVADIILEHHENWDGSGYPYGRRREEIMPEAQLLHLADCFDLLLQHRYKGAPPPLDQFFPADMVGKELSPEWHREFLRVMSAGGLYETVCDDAGMMELLYHLLEEEEPPLKLSGAEHLDIMLYLFADVMDSRHSCTAGHSRMVSRLCKALAAAMGMPEVIVRDLGHAALLHDAGMVAVPRDILEAPRMLDDHEMGLIKSHPIRTMLIINQVQDLSHLSLMAGYHHARYDGHGYPEGLAGRDIPLPSRIMSLCDAFDAMTSPRACRPARTASEALRVLQENSGTQFDPQLVQAALETFS